MRQLLLFILLPLSLYASEEIVVPLAVQQEMPPALVIPYFSKDVPESYQKRLFSTFEFDAQANGRLDVRTPSKNEIELCQKSNPFERERWTSVDYLCRCSFVEGRFRVECYTPSTGRLRTLDSLPLTGNIDKDRHLIHQCSDLLHETLFNEKGICTLKILFTNGGEEGTAEVWEADYDCVNAHPVTSEKALCVTPTYLPLKAGKSKPFFFVSYCLGQPKIFLGSTHTPKKERLTLLKGNQLMPTLSPKGDLVAFISDVAGNPDLFIQPFSPSEGPIGKPRQIYTAPKATQGCPAFHPDGKQIAFVSNKEGTPRIYTMSIPPEGTPMEQIKTQMISKKNRNNTSPAWSPDGTKIAYSAKTKGVRQIWIYDFLSGEEWQLTEGSKHKENPAWAPSGRHLLFNTVEGTQADLYLISLGAKKALKLTSGKGERRFPSWEPA
jgi:TolB protein